MVLFFAGEYIRHSPAIRYSSFGNDEQRRQSESTSGCENGYGRQRAVHTHKRHGRKQKPTWSPGSLAQEVKHADDQKSKEKPTEGKNEIKAKGSPLKKAKKSSALLLKKMIGYVFHSGSAGSGSHSTGYSEEKKTKSRTAKSEKHGNKETKSKGVARRTGDRSSRESLGDLYTRVVVPTLIFLLNKLKSKPLEGEKDEDKGGMSPKKKSF